MKEGMCDYVNFEQWCIYVDSIVAHIEDQGSFPWQCYKKLDIVDKKTRHQGDWHVCDGISRWPAGCQGQVG